MLPHDAISVDDPIRACPNGICTGARPPLSPGAREDRPGVVSRCGHEGKGSSGAGVFSALLAGFCRQYEYSCADLVPLVLHMSTMAPGRTRAGNEPGLRGAAHGLTWRSPASRRGVFRFRGRTALSGTRSRIRWRRRSRAQQRAPAGRGELHKYDSYPRATGRLSLAADCVMFRGGILWVCQVFGGLARVNGGVSQLAET